MFDKEPKAFDALRTEAENKKPGFRRVLFFPSNFRRLKTSEVSFPRSSVAELRPPFGQLLLEAGHNARVHLADARFGEIQRGADLLHRHVFVVVEDDDEAFVAVE